MTAAAKGLATTATNVNNATAMVRRGVTSDSLRFYPELDGASCSLRRGYFQGDIAFTSSSIMRSRHHRSFAAKSMIRPP
jgi:hypothetical protein